MEEKGRNKILDISLSEAQAAEILIWAVEKNNKDLVKLLIKQGVPVNAKNDSAICKAADKGHEEIFEMLLNVGADAKARHNYPLEVAATNGYDEIIESIAVHDPEALKTDNYAINYAVSCGHITTVEKLLALGVKLTHDNDGIINQAEFEGYNDIAELLKKAVA